MRKIIFTVLLFVTTIMSAQEFELSVELRPRYENAHGQKTLLETDADGANFVSQRTRINLNFLYNKIRFGASLQNIRVWGDVGTLSSDDKATAMHVAWAEAILSEKFSVVLGRQEIVYDDSRIFGNVGWAQQARSHDALLAKWKISDKSRLDIGLALSADSRSNIDNLYSNVAGYKAFQYAWYHTDFEKLGLSILALNNGVEFENSNMKNEISYSQTIGTRLTFNVNKFSADFSTYLQSGKINVNSVSTNYFGGNAKFKVSDRFLVGIGGEYLSGKDMNDTSSKVKSFNPLFGTNHKFNGWMDYFYVGNHIGSVGLVDINGVVAYSKDKFSAKVMPHIFSAAADVYDGSIKMDSSLGTEIDLTLGYNISKSIGVSGGHSMMFATESMEVIKGGDKDENNSWTWLMVTFKPTLFSSNK